ncbi:type II toxin-antitoxin system VapC family toxin [Pseudolysinimonas sp.]|uniref:type II toxin-antitoxin system VapC family toxin n=1 Tax=Pseudolysinimonas sp. TaxID=2680009 RepID=UPI00286C3CBA|nr:type II toxin-antitoxin system VapC family toxin [Pseudolysinimonas sp.]
MRAARGLIDTNVLIRLAELDRESLPTVSVISTVTLAELTAGPLIAHDPRERALRQSHVQLAEGDFEALPFDARVARAYGRVAADLRSAGRKTSARAFDALIAATALAHNLPLYTANPDDFAAIGGLDVRAVREREASA